VVSFIEQGCEENGYLCILLPLQQTDWRNPRLGEPSSHPSRRPTEIPLVPVGAFPLSQTARHWRPGPV